MSRRVQILSDHKCICQVALRRLVTKVLGCHVKELWKAIDYLKEQVRVLKEQQEKDKRILLDAHVERFVRSVKEECIDRLILSSEKQLRYVLAEYLMYHHHERIRQGINRIIEPQHEGGRVRSFASSVWAGC